MQKQRKARYQSAAKLREDLKRLKHDSESGRAPAEKGAEKSLAVLYFENQSGEKEDEYFRDGITEDIVTELSKIVQLQIFPRSEMLAFRQANYGATCGPAARRRLRARRFHPPRRQPRADHRTARRS